MTYETPNKPPEVAVLFQDRHLLVVSKPAGMLSQPDNTGDEAIADWGAHWIRQQRLARGRVDPGNPFVAPVHRLDRPVSGVLVMACTSKGAKRLHASFLKKSLHKSYVAMVEGHPDCPMHLRLWQRKDRRRNQVEFQTTRFQGSKEAITQLQVVARLKEHSMISMMPITGRPHQLRCAAAHLGTPIAGDLRYGATEAMGNRIALHACFVRFPHPIGQAPLPVAAPLPVYWFQRWPELASIIPAGMTPEDGVCPPTP